MEVRYVSQKDSVASVSRQPRLLAVHESQNGREGK